MDLAHRKLKEGLFKYLGEDINKKVRIFSDNISVIDLVRGDIFVFASNIYFVTDVQHIPYEGVRIQLNSVVEKHIDIARFFITGKIRELNLQPPFHHTFSNGAVVNGIFRRVERRSRGIIKIRKR